MSRRSRQGQVALLALQRSLAEADRSIAKGDLVRAGTALDRVGNALEAFRSREQDDVEERQVPTAVDVARRAALRRLTHFLISADALLARGDFEAAEEALRDAKEVLDMARALDESAHYSGVRKRFPGRFDK